MGVYKIDNLIILGMDIHALEAIDFTGLEKKYRILGFICNSSEKPDSYGGYPVLGGAEVLEKYPDAKTLPAYGWADRSYRTNWINAIAPGSFISSTAKIGKGCVIFPNCFIGAGAVLGDGILVLSGSIINHDCVIGDNATFASGAVLAGGVKVEPGVYLGQSCTVRQNLVLGENCFVGMGAVVTKNVEKNTTVIGNPARCYAKK